MSYLEKLSISDVKALLDFVTELRNERLIDLKEQNIHSSEDMQYNRYDKLIFQLHSKLFSIVVKLSKDI